MILRDGDGYFCVRWVVLQPDHFLNSAHKKISIDYIPLLYRLLPFNCWIIGKLGEESQRRHGWGH